MNTAPLRALCTPRLWRSFGAAMGALTALCLPTLLGGCGGGGSDPDPSPSDSTSGPPLEQPGWTVRTQAPVLAKKKWTFLVFLNAANDLERYGSLNMNQMEQIGTNQDINIVVQWKRMNGQRGDDHSDGDWVGTRRYQVTSDSDTSAVHSSLLSEKSDVDMGKWESLQEFVRWGTQTYPADRYAVVIWNHGAGWRSRSQNRPGRGVSYDDQTGTHIDTIQLPAALDIDRKWDLVIWDSSLMQMLEVAYEIRNDAQWIVGSEESPPGSGLPYHLFLSQLAANPSMDGRNLGTIICDKALEYYTTNSNSTQSLLDASKVGDLASAVNQFSGALVNVKGTYSSQITEARETAERYEYDENKDLLHFTALAKSLIPDATLQQAATQVQNAASAAIVKNVRGQDHPNSNGVAIYIPSSFRYRQDDIEQSNGFGQRYSELSFAKDNPNWQTFLTQGQ